MTKVERRVLLVLLRSLEWHREREESADGYYGWFEVCPACGNEKRQGHAKPCGMHAAIRFLATPSRVRRP